MICLGNRFSITAAYFKWPKTWSGLLKNQINMSQEIAVLKVVYAVFDNYFNGLEE